MDLILGSSGNLGKVITSILPAKNLQVLNKSDISAWASPTIPIVMREYFKKTSYRFESVFVCAGIIDQNRNTSDLMAINFYLPRNLLQLGLEYGFKTITFGSVHENSLINNPYISSKRAYSNFLSQSHNETNFLHFRLNTLFGGFRNRSNTFLGQLETAIKEKTLFKMSSGVQLREFHNIGLHTSSTLESIINSLDQKGTFAIFHGNPIPLREVATVALENFALLDNLRLGVLPDPPNEIVEYRFFSPKEGFLVNSNGHGLMDIIKYLESRIQSC